MIQLDALDGIDDCTGFILLYDLTDYVSLEDLRYWFMVLPSLRVVPTHFLRLARISTRDLAMG